MELPYNINSLLEVQNIINNNSDKLIIVTDEKNNIIFANNLFINYTGFVLDELKGKNPLSYGLFEKISTMNFQNMNTSNNNNFFERFKNTKKNGDIYYTETQMVPIFKNHKEIYCNILICNIIDKYINK